MHEHVHAHDHDTHHDIHHHGHHHHHDHKLESLNTIFILSIVINLLYVFIEAGVGFWQNSLSLLSDAGHNLGDCFSLLLALAAFKLAGIRRDRRFTYGYKKSTILISLVNAIILLVAVGAIIIESIYKFRNPMPVNGEAVSWTAAAGIVVNGLTVLLLMRSQKDDLNVRGAFLHMLADTLVSVGVVISGVVIMYTGWYVIDPIISFVIAMVILVSTWRLLSESLKLSLDAVPEEIDIEQVRKRMEACQHVEDVHHLHVWAISTQDNALTAHVVVDSLSAMEDVKHEIKENMKESGIGHCTLEFEACDAHCCECELI